MTDVKNYLINGRIKHLVKRNGEFHCAEIGRKMTAVLADNLNHKLTYIVTKLAEFIIIQFFNILGAVNPI